MSAHSISIIQNASTKNEVCIQLCDQVCLYANLQSTTSWAASWRDRVQYPFKQTSKAMLSIDWRNWSAAKFKNKASTSSFCSNITAVLMIRKRKPSANRVTAAMMYSACMMKQWEYIKTTWQHNKYDMHKIFKNSLHFSAPG